jgi:hypothetical protein
LSAYKARIRGHGNVILDTYDDATEDAEMHLFMIGHDGLRLCIAMHITTKCEFQTEDMDIH